ncbi:hypothetical protein ACOMHN_041928 [Nucella lapillus]
MLPLKLSVGDGVLVYGVGDGGRSKPLHMQVLWPLLVSEAMKQCDCSPNTVYHASCPALIPLPPPRTPAEAEIPEDISLSHSRHVSRKAATREKASVLLAYFDHVFFFHLSRTLHLTWTIFNNECSVHQLE